MGPLPILEVSGDEYHRLKMAKRNIFLLLGIEEKFDMVIDNYLEYEHDLLNLALSHMASHDVTWSSFQDAMGRINRRLANCLTVSRLYIDQAKHDLSKVYGKTAEITTRLREAFSTQYDQLLGYRVMEALRNVLQHRSLPVTSLAYPAAWEHRQSRELLHYRVTPNLQLKELREDNDIKASLLDELEQTTRGNYDITLLLREYVEGLSRVHAELRLATNDDIELWKATVGAIIKRYCAACGEDVEFVCAYQMDEEDKIIEEIHVFRDGIDRLEQLRAKRLPTNLSRCYVSNEPL